MGSSIRYCKSEEVLEKKDEILLIFKDIESIDIVIRAMLFAKEQLKKATEPWNIIPLCREHHVLFDSDRNFRREQTKLIEIVKEHDELAANRHFGL